MRSASILSALALSKVGADTRLRVRSRAVSSANSSANRSRRANQYPPISSSEKLRGWWLSGSSNAGLRHKGQVFWDVRNHSAMHARQKT